MKEERNWEGFVKGDVLNFMEKHNLQSISVDEGGSKKATIKKKAAGEIAIQITSNETM